MKSVVVIGAGKIGSTIARLLSHSGDYSVVVADRSAAQLADIEAARRRCKTAEIDIADRDALRALLAGHFAVLSAAPYHLTTAIAEAAADAKVHYLDLTEDVESTRQVREIAAARRASPSFRNAGWRRASSRSSPTIWPAASTRWTASGCGSARCRNIRPTRSTTTSPGAPTASSTNTSSIARRSSTASWSKCRRSRSARSSRSTASPTRRSTRRAGSARCARR